MANGLVSGNRLTLFAPDLAGSEGTRCDLRRLVLVGIAYKPMTLGR